MVGFVVLFFVYFLPSNFVPVLVVFLSSARGFAFFAGKDIIAKSINPKAIPNYPKAIGWGPAGSFGPPKSLFGMVQEGRRLVSWPKAIRTPSFGIAIARRSKVPKGNILPAHPAWAIIIISFPEAIPNYPKAIIQGPTGSFGLPKPLVGMVQEGRRLVRWPKAIRTPSFGIAIARRTKVLKGNILPTHGP